MPDIAGDSSTTASIGVDGTLRSAIDFNGDHDWIRLDLVAGQSVTITLDGAGTTPLSDPYLRLRDSSGTLIAANDDSNGLNSEISFTATTAGTYYIDAGAYGDSGTGTYQVAVVANDTPPETSDIPADSSTTASVAVDGTFDGALEVAGDHDWIRVDLVAGQSVTITLSGEGDTPLWDPYLRLRDSSGTLIAANDDSNGLDSQIVFTAAADGTYYIDAGAYGDGGTGTYRVAVHNNDTISGTEGDDSLSGGAGYDTIYGNGGNDRLEGGDHDDSLFGGAGRDELRGGLGADSMTGGDGNDTYYVTGWGDVVTEVSGEGVDRVRSSITYALPDHVERLTLIGTGAIDGFGNALANRIAGNAAANALYGGDGHDQLNGNNGDDSLDGGGGNDRLHGGAGADAMSGGAGNDSYFVGQAGDLVTETAGEGTDTVVAAISYDLTDSVERLTLTGSGAIDGTGNSLANRINGNSGANSLDGARGHDELNGMGGNDRLSGKLGNDTLTGGEGADIFVFDTGLNRYSNVDQISDFTVADDTMELDQSVFTALSLGTLSADAFRTGTSAQDANDRIIYDSATGRIYYDADGSGSGAQVLFAQVTAGTALTNADFLVVG